MNFPVGEEVVPKEIMEFVELKSRFVFKIEDFLSYEIGKVFTSRTINFIEIDSTWKIVVQRIDRRIDSVSRSVASVSISIGNLPKEIWMSKQSQLLIEILGGPKSSVVSSNNSTIGTAECIRPLILQREEFDRLSDKFDVNLKIKSLGERVLPRKFYDPFPVARNTLALVRDLFIDPMFSDFTFIVQGKEFKTHKIILAGGSSVMRKMFTTNFKEASNHECIVSDIRPEIFELMLRFIYGLVFPNDISKSAEELYKAAHYYEIEELKKICKQEFHHQLATKNCLKIYEFACCYDIENLKMDAWTVIKREILKVYKPLIDEPWPLQKIEEGVRRNIKYEEFLSKHKEFWK